MAIQARHLYKGALRPSIGDRPHETSLPSAADIQPQLDSSNITLAGPSLDNVSSPEPATSTVATAGAFTLTFSQTELATATLVNADLSAASSSSNLPRPIVKLNSEGIEEVTLTLVPLSMHEEEVVTAQVRKIDLIKINILPVQF